MAKPKKPITQSKTTGRQAAGVGITGGLGAALFAAWDVISPDTAPGSDVRNIIIAALAATLGPLLSRWFSSRSK